MFTPRICTIFFRAAGPTPQMSGSNTCILSDSPIPPDSDRDTVGVGEGSEAEEEEEEEEGLRLKFHGPVREGRQEGVRG